MNPIPPTTIYEIKEKIMAKKETPIQKVFRNFGSSLTVNCFDEDSEMYFVIRSDGRKTVYGMTIDEVKGLKNYLNAMLKCEKDAYDREIDI